MNHIIQHYNEAVELFGAVVGVVTLITKLTATQKDDSVWGKILKVLSIFSLVNPDGSVSK